MVAAATSARKPIVLLNPELSEQSAAMFELWDDCMCFPNLLVRVQRHETVTVSYRDAQWQPQRWPVQGAVAELLQHECDHLDGMLYPQRMTDLSKLIFESEFRHVVAEARARAEAEAQSAQEGSA